MMAWSRVFVLQHGLDKQSRRGQSSQSLNDLFGRSVDMDRLNACDINSGTLNIVRQSDSTSFPRD